jgi:hypothetical protein
MKIVVFTQRMTRFVGKSFSNVYPRRVSLLGIPAKATA